MTKKSHWYKSPQYVTGIIACIAALGTAVVVLSNYIQLPDRVEAAEQKIETVQDYIKEQRIANDLMKEMFQQQQQYQQQQPQYPAAPQDCQYDDYGVYWCWNGYEWREV